MRLLNKITSLEKEIQKIESLVDGYKRRQELFIRHTKNTFFNNRSKKNNLITGVLFDSILETDKNKKLDLAVKAVQMEYWDHTRRFKVRKGV
jgi:hypothetical protein